MSEPTSANAVAPKHASLEESLEAAKQKYTPEQIAEIMSLGVNCAGKAVLNLVIKYVEMAPIVEGQSENKRKKIIQQLKTLQPNVTSPLELEFQEEDMRGWKMIALLSIVTPEHYRPIAEVPNAGYAEDLYRNYDGLKQFARAYWRQFVESNPKLYKLISCFVPSVVWNELEIDPKEPTTLGWDFANFPARVGILVFYVGPDGRPGMLQRRV